MNDEALFSENQSFRQIWIWVILIGINGVMITGLLQQLLLGRQFGDEPLSDAGLILVTILTFGFTAWFFTLHLETRISKDGIGVRFSPFHRKMLFYSKQEIAEAYVRVYKPIREYGGWGLRGLGKNRALNVSGNMGIQLVMRNGHRLLIGTRSGEDAAHALSQIGLGTATSSMNKT